MALTYGECLHRVLANAKDPYAKAYAKAGLGMTGEEARVQALYVMSNLHSWRGDVARETKAFLKEFSKRK